MLSQMVVDFEIVNYLILFFNAEYFLWLDFIEKTWNANLCQEEKVDILKMS